MHYRAWTAAALGLLVVGVGLFLSGPRETSFVTSSSDSQLPSGIYWLPAHRLLGIGIGIVGLILISATTAYAAGVRKGRSATS